MGMLTTAPDADGIGNTRFGAGRNADPGLQQDFHSPRTFFISPFTRVVIP
ncbi:hypothetical protein PTTG_30156 [Puccinia triticina 1-1 BBBD Race 1]|uniref:Uncharacterized protein n=1 Tax=Puccinia triticina (isolate 1-1 / race 1 (BBBD)) TaxID=630390 RepID=A0A180G017_PUCT1|nr:hypothetical protein PTTG_30156 [Puccinia triticina 1-1 BBBD Race 1]